MLKSYSVPFSCMCLNARHGISFRSRGGCLALSLLYSWSFTLGSCLSEEMISHEKWLDFYQLSFHKEYLKSSPFKKWYGLFITSRMPFSLMATQYMVFSKPCNFHYQSATLHFFFCWLIYLQIIYSSQDIAKQLEEANNVKAEQEWMCLGKRNVNLAFFVSLCFKSVLPKFQSNFENH